MKIGIFGGTFDPVHRGHLQLARMAREQCSLDKVIFVPAFQPPHKQHLPSGVSAKHRYEMVRLALEEEGRPFFEISDCEFKRKGISYTFDTLREFEKKYPGAVFFLILGQDAFEGISTWHRADELKEKVYFLAAQRGNCDAVMTENARVQWVQMPLCPISASGIREALKQGQDVNDYLSPKILEYIHAHALYGES